MLSQLSYNPVGHRVFGLAKSRLAEAKLSKDNTTRSENPRSAAADPAHLCRPSSFGKSPRSATLRSPRYSARPDLFGRFQP